MAILVRCCTSGMQQLCCEPDGQVVWTCAGLHWFPQLNLVLQHSGGGLGAGDGALGYHPQAGCQPQPPGTTTLPFPRLDLLCSSTQC